MSGIFWMNCRMKYYKFCAKLKLFYHLHFRLAKIIPFWLLSHDKKPTFTQYSRLWIRYVKTR